MHTTTQAVLISNKVNYKGQTLHRLALVDQVTETQRSILVKT